MEDLSKLALKLMLLFAFAQFAGVYAGAVILEDISHNPYLSSLVATTQPDDAQSAVLFFMYIVASVVLLMVLMKFIKFDIVFRAMEFILISTSSSVVFYALLRNFLFYDLSIIFGIVLAVALAAIKFFYAPAKNIATIASAAGVGAIFGMSFSVVSVIIFLLLLSFYDYVAVFITKHMVGMADFLIKKDLAFTITAKQKFYSGSGIEPREKRIDLGSGDLVAPVMFEVTLLSYSPVASIFVFLGAIVSFSMFLVMVFKKRTVLPALPPLVLGMVAFFILGSLLGLY